MRAENEFKDQHATEPHLAYSREKTLLEAIEELNMAIDLATEAMRNMNVGDFYHDRMIKGGQHFYNAADAEIIIPRHLLK